MVAKVTSGIMVVRSVEERTKRIYVSGFGPSTQFRDESVGWFVTVYDYPTAIEMGREQPELKIGDKIWIEIHKEG